MIKEKIIIKAIDSLAEAVFKVVSKAMELVPFGALGAMTAVAASKGLGILVSYAVCPIALFLWWATLFFIFCNTHGQSVCG